MFKGLMRRSSSSSTPDGRSQSNSNGKKSSGIWRKKTDSKSKATSRGDDRDRSLGDLPADSAPPSSGRRSYEPSVASESAAKVDRDTRGARRRDRERSSSPEPVPRRLNGNEFRSRDDSANEESNRRREPQRWPPGDVSLPPLDTGAAHTTSDQFAADIASPGFSQFPMQYDNNYNYDSPNYNNPVSIPPPLMPNHPDSSPTSPATFDPHVPQQFPGQFPTNTAEPYRPYNNPAGEAADYYGDQGQSVQNQPGVRPNPPLVIPNSQAHLMPASPGANPPPEPSSMGQVGSAAEFYADSPDLDNPVPQQQPPEEPPKPSKPSKPSAAPAGIPSGPPSYDTPDSPVPPEAPGSAGTQPVGYTQNSPTQSHSMGPAIGAAAAAAAVGYMANHNHNSSTSSSEHPLPSSYTQNHEPYSPIGQPGPAIYPNPALNNPNYASHPNHPDHEAVYHSSPFQSGGLAFQQRQRGPLDKFIDFWKDHEGVGMYEEYTEAIGVCKYCFEPGTTSRDAPRKHNYRPRRRSSDRFSNDSRVDKSSRYSPPSDDESRRRRSSSKRSWFGGLFSGSAAKALFESQDFEDSYNVRPSRVSSPRLSSSDSESDSDRKSKPSRRRRRSSLSQSPGGSRCNSHSDPRRSRYEGPRLRSRSRSSSDSRSRSSSRSDRHSPIRDFALGAAVGSVAAAATSRPQKRRSRSPKRKGKGRKKSTTEDSSSSSYLDISRPTTAGSLGSFFNTPSENKKKPRPKSRKGFFPFSNNNSSSSSLDDDLAFGTAYAKKPKKSKKGKGKKKDEDVNAKLLELSAMATTLAGSTQGRRSGEILAGKDPRSHRSQSAPSAPKDDEWEDYSEGQESSVSSALAFGGSSQYGGSSSSEDSSDSGTSKWNWRWGSKKDKKKNEQKKDSPSHGDFPTGSILAGTALGTAALASGYRKEGEHFSSPSSSSSESLQQLDPIPASDPPRFNASSFPSSSSAQEPAFIRPGPIPLQQPQPVTPVSQAVYSSQGEPAPVYNAPTIPPFFPPDAFYDPASGGRDEIYPQRSDVSSNWNRAHRRRESSPDFYPGPFQDFTPSSYNRRPTDQASVQFDLTEEQKDKERRAARRERERRDNDRDQDIQLLDHESEEEENERREPRRVERLELEPERGRSRSRSRSSTRRDHSPDRRRWDDDDSSSWIGPAAAGTIGAAVAAAAMPSGAPSESASESSQRHRERSEKRRAERVPPFSEVGWDRPARAEPKEEPQTQPEPADVDVEDESQIAPEDQSRPGKNPTTRTPRTKPTHESYATYFAPKEDRHSPDAQTEHREDASMSTIPEDEPEPPSQQNIEPPSKYLGGLPWNVPRLHLIEPTPPHSQNGSARDVASPDPSAAEPSQKEEAPRREQGSTTGSRVSWGGNETHEYEVHSTSSEQDSDYEMADEPDDMQRDPVDHGMAQEPVGMQRDPVDHGMAQEPIGMQRYPVDYKMAQKPEGMQRDPVDHGMAQEPIGMQRYPVDYKMAQKPEGMQRDPVDHGMAREPEGMKRGPIQQDIEFATILDATTKDAGFDPAIMTADPYYDTRSSPPQAEYHEFSEYEPSWHKPAHHIFEPHGAGRDEAQTPPREEREPEAMEYAPEVKRHREAIGRFNAPKAKETMPGSFEEESVKPTEDPSPRPVVEEKRPRGNDRPPKRRSSRDSARDDPRKTSIDVSRPEPISEEPRSKKERKPVNNDIPSKEDRDIRVPGEFAPIALAAFPPGPISEEPRSAKKQQPVKNETPWEDYHQSEAPRESERPVSPPSPGSGYRMSQGDLNKSELVFGENPRESERPVSPPSPGSGYRMSQGDLNKSELVFGENPRESERPVSPPSPGSGYRMSQDDLNKSELVLGEIPRAPSPSGYRLSQDDLSKSELVFGEIPRAPSPSGYRLSQDDLDRSEFVLEDNRKPVPPRERDPAPAVSRLPLRRGRRSQDKLHSKDDNVALSDKGPKDTAPAVSAPEPVRQEHRRQSQSNRMNDGPLKDNDKSNYSLPARPKPKEANEDYPQPTRAPSGDTPDFRDRSQPTSQQQQQRPQKSETTTRQGPKEPSPAVTPREPPSEEYRGKDERDVAPEEARKARGLKDTVPAPRPLIWNEPRSEDGPTPAVKDDAAFENNSRPVVSEETPSDEFVLAPNGEERWRRDEPDSNNDNVLENDRGARGEEDNNVQRYRFSRQEEKRQREEERRRQEAEGIAGPNGQTREEEYEKDRKDAEEHEPARSAETPVKVDDGKDNTEDLRLPFPLSVPESRLRSRSISPPGSAKAMVDVGPKSRSRPTSPESSRQRQSLHATDGDRSRRLSMLQDSPTAVPLQFRRPPSTSPTGRRSPSVGSPELPALSLSSPPERRARRRSMEFVNSREIMPLFLVEQNGQHQHPIEEQLPSLPSSKSSSRTSSPVKNLGPDEKGWEAVEPIQDENVEEQSKPKPSTVIPSQESALSQEEQPKPEPSTVISSQEPALSQEEQPKPEPSTVIPSQEPALSQEEQPNADLSIPTQDSAELEKEGERGISRETEAEEPIDEPLPPLPSSHGSLNASIEDLSVVPDAQSWKVLDLTHDIHPKEDPKLDLATRSEERRGEEEHAKEGNAEKESERPEAQEPIEEPLPSLPSSHGSLNSPARDLETDPNEKDWKAFDLTQDVHSKDEINPGPPREPSGEEELKEKDEGERDIQKVEAQAPIDEQFPPLPSSNGSLKASVEDLSAVSDEQTQDPIDLTEDTQFEEQPKPEPSISTPALQAEDEPKPNSPITSPSHEPTDGDETERKSGAKDISEKAATQEPVDEPLPPLPSSKGSSLNASVENFVPGEEDWNPIDMTQAVHEEQPGLGLSFQEPVGGDEEKETETETEKEKAKAPEPIDKKLPPLPSSKGSSLNASVEDLSSVPGEEDWNPVDLTQAVREEQPEFGLPSREPVDDGENKKEKAKAPAPIDKQLPPLPSSNDSSLNASVEDLDVVSGEDSWNMVDQPEEQPKPDFPTGIPSQEPIGDRDSQPEDKPKPELSITFPFQEPALNQDAQAEDQPKSGFSITAPSQEPALHQETQLEDHQQPDLNQNSQSEDKPKSELTIKFPSQEFVLNQETQPEDQFERGFSMTPHSLEPILEEAEDEIQPDPSTTIPFQPILNRDTPLNYEPQPDPSVTIPPQEPSDDDDLEKEKEKGKEMEKGLSDSQEEPLTEETTYDDTTSLETREKGTSGWEVVDPIQIALPEEQAEPDFSNTAPSQQPTLSQDAQPDQPRDLSVTPPQEVAGEEESKEMGKEKATDSSDAQQEQPTKERVEKDPPPPYESHEEDEAVIPTQDVQPEPQRKPSLSIAIPSQEPEDELEEKYAKAREKDTDFHEFDTIDEEWTASEIMRERERHKHEFDIHSPAELLWDPHKYFITPRPIGGMGSRSFGGSLAPRSYEPPKIQDDDIDISDPDEDISPPESGPSGPPGKETSAPEPAEMTAPTQKEKSENSEDPGIAGTRDEEEQPKETIPETQHAHVGEDKTIVPDIEVTPPVKDTIIHTVPVTAPKEEEQAPSTPDFGGVVDATVAVAVDASESHPVPETQTDIKENEPAVPEIEITPAVKDKIAPTVSDVPVPATASKEEEQTQSNSPSDFAAIVDAAFAAATGPTDDKAVPEEGVARDLPVESKGDLSSKVPPPEGSTATTESDFLDASQQSEDGQEPYRTLSPIMEEPDLESERSQSVDLAHDEQTPSQESEKMELEAPAAEDTSVSRAPLGKQSPVPEVEPTATAPETERAPDITTKNVQNTGEASQEAQPSDEAQSVTTETATSRDGYAESTQDSGTDFWDAVEKHEEGEGSIASSLDRPIDTPEPPTPREWRTEASFEPEVPAQDVQVSPVEEFSRSTPVEEEREDAGTPKAEDQLLEKTGSTQVPIEAQNAISQSDITRDEPPRQIEVSPSVEPTETVETVAAKSEPAVAGSEQLLDKLPEQTEQLVAGETKSLVKPALEVIPEAAADAEAPQNATEKFPQTKSKEDYEKDRKFSSSLEPLTETEAEHSQPADAVAGAGAFETSGEVPATTDARHQNPEPAGAQDVEPVPAASEGESITPVEKPESNIAAHGPLSLETEQTPAPAPPLEPGATPEDKQNVEDSGERSKHGSPSTTLDEAATIELPPSPHAEVADVNVPAVTSDALPSSLAPTEEPSQEQPIEREMPHFTADNESLADVVTRAQKRKAKKERRKKRHFASLDESVPATPQDETDPIDKIAPVKAPSVDKDSAIVHEPTEAIPEQPRDDVPPADIEHREAPETSVEQVPPKSDASIYPEATIVQGPVAGAETIQEKAQDEITPTVETSGTTAESTVTEPEPTQEERDITTSVEPVSTSSDHVEEAPKEDLTVGTNVNAPVQDPTATEPSSAKDVPQDDPAHAQDQPQREATNVQELPSLEKDDEEAPVTEPPSHTNSKKNKKHRRSASSEIEQPAPAEDVADTPSIEALSEAPAASQTTEEKPVESPVTETQEELHPTMSKKQAKRERKKRRSMINMGQSPDELPVESAQPTAVHGAPAQELQQQPDNDSAVKPSQTVLDNASAEGFEIIDAPSDTPIESITPDLQEQAIVEESREAPAQKGDEAIAQEVPQVKEKEEPKSDLETQPFESKGAGLLNPLSETAQVKEPEGSTLHPADAEDTSSLSGETKNKVRHHRRRRSRILEHLAEAEAERERERAKQASTKENPTGTLPVTESKPTTPVEDSDMWTDPSISSQIEQGREAPFAFPYSEQVDDNRVVPALNEEPRAQLSSEEPEAVAGPIEVKAMESQAGHDSQVEQRTQESASTPSGEERELVPETAPVMEEKTKEFTPANQEIVELPSIQTEKSERSLDIIGPIPANEPAATVDAGEVLEKLASDVAPSQTHEQPSINQEESTNPQETVLLHDSPTAEPRQDSAPATPSRKRSRKEKKRARKRAKENHEGSASPEEILSESTTALIEQPPLVSDQVKDAELPRGDEQKVFAEEQTEESKAKVEDPGTTGEKAVQEPVEQPHRREPMEPVEGQPTAQPLENEQPPTQEKKKEAQKEEQVTVQEPRSNDNDVEAVNESQTEKASDSAPESSMTSRLLNRVSGTFPDLKREKFRLPSKNQSVKDRAEDETTEPEVSRGFENEHAAWVSEVPITSQDYQRERLSSAEPFEDEPSFQLSTTTNPETTITDVAIDVEVDEYYKVSILSDRTTGGSPAIEIDPTSGDSAESAEQSPDNERSAHGPPSSDDRSFTVVDSSSTQADTSRGASPSRDSRRSPSISQTTKTSRSLAPSPPLPDVRDRVERTDGVRTTDRNGKPRLEIKPVDSLRPRTPRSTSPIRKYTGNAWAQQATKKHGENPVIKPPVRQNSLPTARRPQTPERKPILRPSSMSNFHGVPNMQQTLHSPDVPRSLRRKSKTTRDMSADLRAASRALQEENGSQPPPTDINIERIASSSSYDPVTDKGKRPIRGMTDVYEAWGETPSSPRSPSRPPSVRHRRSMQHLQQLESRLDQLISENRLLSAEREAAENKLKTTTLARRKSDQALNSQNTDLRDRSEEVEELRKSVEWFQKEVNRLTEENEGLTGTNANLAATHEREHQEFQESSAREIQELRTRYRQATANTRDLIRRELDVHLAQKNAELRRLSEELQEEQEKVQQLQQKLATSEVLVHRNDQFFKAACHNLYARVQHWVKRFSKHSDNLRYLTFDQLQDPKALAKRLETDKVLAARLDVGKLARLDVNKLTARFDNAILDGSDVEYYLADRVGRRDVFISVMMTMMWKFIFAPYMFGMDSEKQQKLNSLEEQLTEAGKFTAVRRWRATTLSLLSKSPSFAEQREIEMEAVTHEIYDTLESICPPPKDKVKKLREDLHGVLQIAVTLSIEMRTQLAEYYIVRPLLAEFGDNGVVTRRVHFNEALMNERSALDSGAGEGSVRLFLFPLVVKEHDDSEEDDKHDDKKEDKGPVVIYPAQVLVNRPEEEVKQSSKSLDRKSSVQSSVPSLRMDNT